MKFLCTILICLGLFATQSRADQSWVKDPDLAFTRAETSNRPILVYLNAPQSTWSVRYEKSVFTDRNFKSASNNYVLFQFESSTERRRFVTINKVVAIPSVLLLDSESKVLSRLNGLVSTELLLGEMKLAAILHKEDFLVKTETKQNLTTSEKAKLAFIYASRSSVKKAEELLKSVLKEDPKNSTKLVPRILWALGDNYQLSGDYKKALNYFKQGFALPHTMAEKGYFLVSMAACYSLIGDRELTQKYYRECITTKGIPKVDVETAAKFLENAVKSTNRSGADPRIG